MSFCTKNSSFTVFISFLSINAFPQAVQWLRTVSFSSYNYGHSVSVDSSGYIYFVGSYSNPSGGFINKYDTYGNLIWSETMPVYIADSQTDPVGNICITGTGKIAKFNSSDSLLW